MRPKKKTRRKNGHRQELTRVLVQSISIGSKTKYFMKLALSEAEKAKERDEVPVGAIIVNPKNEVISSNGNRMRELNDPTSHAEILVIRNACKILKTTKLFNFSLFTTLEPCAMCAMAISLVGIKNLYFATEDKDKRFIVLHHSILSEGINVKGLEAEIGRASCRERV